MIAAVPTPKWNFEQGDSTERSLCFKSNINAPTHGYRPQAPYTCSKNYVTVKDPSKAGKLRNMDVKRQ